MMPGHKHAYDCFPAFSETDITEDLRKFDVPISQPRRHEQGENEPGLARVSVELLKRGDGTGNSASSADRPARPMSKETAHGPFACFGIFDGSLPLR